MNKIIIASDSFKGSISSAEIAEAAEKAIKEIYPNIKVQKISVADGGEGTIAAVKETTATKTIKVNTCNPLGKPIIGEYIVTEDNNAIIELATASGITTLDDSELNPNNTSTYGTGIMIADALKRGYRNITLTLGGSATNDGGTGLLQALGIIFSDKKGNTIQCNGQSLIAIDNIDTSNLLMETKNTRFTLACDVSNPFYGKNGAAYVFARQKGATEEMIEQLDKGLENLSKVITKIIGKDISDIPGSGAAGGTSGGMMAFLNAKIISGAEFILQACNFDKLAEGADLVITGEGKIDIQTLSGKLPYVVAQHSIAQGAKVIAICGTHTDEIKSMKNLPFTIIEVTPRNIPLQIAMKKENASTYIYNSVKRYLLNNTD